MLKHRFFNPLRRISSPNSSWRVTPWWLPEGSAEVRSSVIRLLSFAHRERFDPANLFKSFALEHRGLTRMRLQLLARRLGEGTNVIDALEQSPGVLSDEDVLTLRFASQSGTLSHAYEDLKRRSANGTQDSTVRIKQAILYGGCLLLATICILSFLMVFIAPTYLQIYRDFGLQLPQQLQRLISVSDTIVRNLPLIVAIILVACGLAWLFDLRRRLTTGPLSRFFKPVSAIRSAHVLRMLAMSADAGRPIAGAISTLARYHFDTHTRVRLLEARNEIEHGSEPFQTLADTDLLTEHESQTLAASDSEMRVWLMRRLADWKEERIKMRSQFMSMFVQPAIVLLFGGIVFWIVGAFFGVLSQLVSALS